MFASGSCSNFQALLDQEHAGSSSWTTALLVTDRESAGALDRASRAGVSGRVVSYRGRSLDEVAAELSEALDEAGVEVIFLAGFLRLVPEDVVARFRDRILNIHPALLPAFGGEGMWGHHVHEAVLASGARLSGPTVHLVDERCDHGPILLQAAVPVESDDTVDSLAARILEQEHRLYPEAVRLFFSNRLRFDGRRVSIAPAAVG